MNIVVLQGQLTRAPEERELPSGDRLVSFEVTTRTEGRAETAPVVWFDPPGRVATLEPGDEVVVAGRVRRRFFKAGGGTQSRTEVVADAVVRARQAKQVASLLAGARARLGDDGAGC